ncbi:hypothetical protein FPOAC2_05371 [Fusarium poae]|jgi:hypothetical protein|uniref:Uncharacterized protein n=1 Tax=Fusarium poae TaxID=36050 RepID=A0A1B8AV16_FUSPO|nr:hypothetical protein FPOAC1_005264 [Fusarium poae]KAG8672005.1 hypothetical protein FPOAC1_005264 [Fusarium poae]OBS24221.1 hypothetical protein FPOA_04768 [Fusarium poae]
MESVTITFEGIEEWENSGDIVYDIIQKHTQLERGSYPETKSLPPLIMSPPLPQECIDELKAVNGVVVRTQQG